MFISQTFVGSRSPKLGDLFCLINSYKICLNGLIKQWDKQTTYSDWNYPISYNEIPIILDGNGNANFAGHVTSILSVSKTKASIDPSYGSEGKGTAYVFAIGY